MATQIEVVDINDNNNDNEHNNAVIQESSVKEVKPKKPRAKPRAKVKVQPVVEPVVEEVIEPVVEEVIEPVVEPVVEPVKVPILEPVKVHVIEPIVEEVRTITDGATKGALPCPSPIKVKPKNNRDKLKDKVNCPDCNKEVTVHGLRYTHAKYCKAVNKPKPEQAPPISKITDISQPVFESQPTEEQIANYLLMLKQQRANVKRDKMSSLVSKGLPQ